MPRFHLNIVNGDGLTPDEEGRDFADLGAARAEAIRGIRSLLADELEKGSVQLGGRIEIADGSGNVVQSIAFSEAFEIRS